MRRVPVAEGLLLILRRVSTAAAGIPVARPPRQIARSGASPAGMRLVWTPPMLSTFGVEKSLTCALLLAGITQPPFEL